MKNNGLSHPFVGFAVGLGVGAALGILFAPKSGEETREFLADGTRDAIDDVVATSDAAERVMDATDAGEQAFTRAKSA